MIKPLSITNGRKLSRLFFRPGGIGLVEMLLYISISAVILLVISIFLSTILRARIKSQSIAEVEQQGLQVMQLITYSIRQSESINSPGLGTTASTLSLKMVDVSRDPTVFDLFDGAIRTSEGAGSATALTSSRVITSGLTFQNLSQTNTPGIIQVQFTLSHLNPEGQDEYTYSRIFNGSASLRLR